MRMWMIDPSLMCRQHLLGEHAELHKHRHCFVKGHDMRGRIGAIEPMSMKRRHDELAKEMLKRGYKHDSPYKQPSLSDYSDDIRLAKIDVAKAIKMLCDRCTACSLIFMRREIETSYDR